MMGKIDLDHVPDFKGCAYPAPHDAPCKDRRVKPSGLASGYATKAGEPLNDDALEVIGKMTDANIPAPLSSVEP